MANNITSVLFYPAAEGGGIDLRFANDAVISLYMADIGSNLTLLPGTYAFTIDSPTPEAGSGTLTLTAVPEPDTWALMIAGIGGLGLALRASRPRRVKSWALAA